MFLNFYQVTYDNTVLVTESDKKFFDISDTSDDSEIDGDFNEQVSFYTVISKKFVNFSHGANFIGYKCSYSFVYQLSI